MLGDVTVLCAGRLCRSCGERQPKIDGGLQGFGWLKMKLSVNRLADQTAALIVPSPMGYDSLIAARSDRQRQNVFATRCKALP